MALTKLKKKIGLEEYLENEMSGETSTNTFTVKSTRWLARATVTIEFL